MKDFEAASALAEFSTACISDAMSALGMKDRTMSARIKPVRAGMRVCGPAATAECYPGCTRAVERAIALAPPGSVIAVDGKGYTGAVLWGEIYSRMAMLRRASGTVLDGAARDVEEVARLGYPLFAAGITPSSGTDGPGETGGVISCGGVVVCPGDFVCGDALGVTVVPRGGLREVLRSCRSVAARESKLISRLDGELAALKQREEDGREDA